MRRRTRKLKHRRRSQKRRFRGGNNNNNTKRNNINRNNSRNNNNQTTVIDPDITVTSVIEGIPTKRPTNVTIASPGTTLPGDIFLERESSGETYKDRV